MARAHSSFAELFDTFGADEGFDPADDIQDMPLIVEGVERHVVNDGSEQRGGFGGRFSHEGFKGRVGYALVEAAVLERPKVDHEERIPESDGV